MSSIANPTASAEIDGQKVEFRELRAVEGIQFLKLLSKHAASFKESGDGQWRAGLIDLVTGAEEVSTYLVLKSAQKDHEWLDAISASGFLTALQTALDLNLSEVVIKKAHGVAASVKSRLAGTPQSETSSGQSSS